MPPRKDPSRAQTGPERGHLTRLRILGLTAGRFATLTGQHPVTVLNWGKPRSGRDVQRVPDWVPLLLDAWEAHPELVPRDQSP